MSKLMMESSAFAGHESDGPCTILPGGRPVTADGATQTDIEAVSGLQTAVGDGQGAADGGFHSLPSVVSWVEASRTARGQYTGEAGGGLGLVASEVLRGIVSEAGRRVAAGMVPAGSGESAPSSRMSNAKENQETVGDVGSRGEQATGIAPIELESQRVNFEITPRSAGVAAAQVVQGVVARVSRGRASGAVGPQEFDFAVLSNGGGDSAIRGSAVSERDALLNDIESLKARLAQALELRGNGQVMLVGDGVNVDDSVWGVAEGGWVPRYADDESRDRVQGKVIGLWAEVKALTDEKLGWMLRMDELMREHQK